MAQTGLGVFAGEQIASFLVRIVCTPVRSKSSDADNQAGTILGLIVGMVIWYIGAPGNGSGNPYGITVVTVSLL